MNKRQVNDFPKETAEEAQAQVRAARSAVQSDFDELRNSISANQIVDFALESLRDVDTGKMMDQAKRTVQEHPLPSALTAAGIAWLAYSLGTQKPKRAAEAARTRSADERADDGFVYESPSAEDERYEAERLNGHGPVSRAAAAGREKMRAAQERARHAGEEAAEASRQAGRKVKETYEAHPLVTGLIGLAAGAALAGYFSRTRAEDVTMGEARDAVMRKAKEEGSRYARAADEKAAEAMRKASEKLDQARDGLLRH